MDSNELRAACEMAGLSQVARLPTDTRAWMNAAKPQYLYFDDDPALPAYAAELLAQRDEITGYDVSEMDLARVPYKYECEVLSSELEKHTGTGDTPAEAIIRAAMDAIGATTEESA